MKKKKKVVRGVFIASMAVIGVGFAALSNINLKITGEASVGPNTEAFNVRFTKVMNTAGDPLVCNIVNDQTVSCTANLKEMYDYENSHDYFGGSLVKFKYTGDENIQAEVTKVISATGNTESIVVDTGYCHSFMSNGICSTGNGWDDYEAYLLKNCEEKGLAITVSSANAKSGDKIEFEVKLVAKPVSNK